MLRSNGEPKCLQGRKAVMSMFLMQQIGAFNHFYLFLYGDSAVVPV